LPAFIEGEKRAISILIESTDPLDALRTWASVLALQEVGSDRTVALQIDAIRAVDAPDHAYANEYLRHRSDTGALVEIVVSVPRYLLPQSPRTASIFHLVRGATIERSRAVAVMADDMDALRVAFATDLHVARSWDAIAAAIDRHAPDLDSQFCHPQRLLAAFVAEANRLAAHGELDLVVLGGDLVDHVYPTLRSNSAATADSNVQLLLDLLAPLTVPVIAIPGNHDYRVNPWRPRTFGLGSVGIPRPRLGALLKAAGMWERWRLRPSDRDALRTRDSNGVDGLWPHLSLLAPATDFHVDLRGVRLVFFATGRDVVLRWRGLDWQRRSLLVRSLPTSWMDPDSEGPSDEQMQRLSSALGGCRNAVLFFHAPILNPNPETRVEDRLDHIHPGEHADRSTQVSFERRLQRSGLRCGVSFRNMAPLIRAMISVPGSVATFSGHVHRSSRVEIDRASLRVHSATIASERGGSAIIPLHIGASLGHVRSPGSEPPGFLLADIEAGTLRRVQSRVLGRPR